LSIKNKKYTADSSSRILHFYRILKAKDFSSLAFFLAQMEKESPEFKTPIFADQKERPREAPFWALEKWRFK
jgi:hypothetical protein